MTTWTTSDLDRIGDSEELRLASRRDDGTLRPPVVMWVVRSGTGLYVRAAHGPQTRWFTRALASGAGRVHAGGVERDVTFAAAAPGAHADIDNAYHAKYDRYGPAVVGSVVGAQAVPVTIRLLPRSST